jgi:general secretion pathway protein I
MDRGAEAGFSLIEALVALAILAVAAISLLTATEAHVARIAGLESRALAQIAAENRLAELELGLAGDDMVTLLGHRFAIDVTRVGTADPEVQRIDIAVTDLARSETFRGFFGFLASPAGGIGPVEAQ